MSNSKTKPSQRILIGLVAVFMLFSTVAMYIGIILTNKNPQPEYPQTESQQAKNQEYIDKIMKQYEARSKYFEQLGDELSNQHYAQFREYEQLAKAYNAESIKTLETNDLVVGDGDEIKNASDYQAYYIGWIADGKIFDTSLAEDKLKPPLQNSKSLIEGWKKGVIGMKIGGVREISIPAKQAYGEKEQGEIPANSPLKFIVKLIPPMTEEQKANIPKVD